MKRISLHPSKRREKTLYISYEKEGKNVIYHIFDTTHHDSGRKGKRQEKM
jgi:hypothetical protein